MLDPLSSLKHCCGWIGNIDRSVSLLHDSISPCQPGEVMVVVSMVTRDGHISLTAVRVAGEPSQIGPFSHIVWLGKDYIEYNSEIYFCFTFGPV